jgi:unspecific monooxygenase
MTTWFELDPGRSRATALRELPEVRNPSRASPEGRVRPRWDDVRALLREPALRGRRALRVRPALGITDGPLRRWYGESHVHERRRMTHNRLRSLVQKAFVPSSIEVAPARDTRDRRRSAAPVAVRGSGDLLDLATHVPIRAIAKLVGVGDDEPRRVHASARSALRASSASCSPRRSKAATQAIEELLAFTRSLLDAPPRRPPRRLITRLFQAELDW